MPQGMESHSPFISAYSGQWLKSIAAQKQVIAKLEELEAAAEERARRTEDPRLMAPGAPPSRFPQMPQEVLHWGVPGALL